MTEEWIEVTEEVLTRASGRSAPVNLYFVESGHENIDRRLQNWGLWSRSRFGQAVAPGFEKVQSSWARTPSDAWPKALAVLTPDDAQKIARGVAELPVRNAAALSWCYVTRTWPKQICTHLDLLNHRGRPDLQALYDLIRAGRQRLIEAGV